MCSGIWDCMDRGSRDSVKFVVCEVLTLQTLMRSLDRNGGNKKEFLTHTEALSSQRNSKLYYVNNTLSIEKLPGDGIVGLQRIRSSIVPESA